MVELKLHIEEAEMAVLHEKSDTAQYQSELAVIRGFEFVEKLQSDFCEAEAVM